VTVAEILQHGVESLRNGDAEGALRSANEVLARHPGLSVAHLVRGRALLEVGDVRGALEALREATQRAPDSAEAHATLGSARLAAGDMHDALAAYTRALELAPGSASIQVRVAAFLLELGDLDSAEQLYGSAAAIGSQAALCGLLALRERRGDVQGAERMLGQLGDLGAAPLDLRLTAARVMRRAGRAQDALALLETIEIETLTRAQQVLALHALGDVLDELGQSSRAFAAWKRANELRGLRFEASALAERVDELCLRFTRDKFASLPRASHRDQRPVFVVGVPRSGTSLVEQILSAHPRIACAGELDDVPRLTSGLDLRSQSELDRAAARYLARLDAFGAHAQRVTDKLPHNAFHLGEIALLFPAARVIRVRRDPLDVGLSIYSRNFHATHDYATDLTAIGTFLREYERAMAHWREHLPLRVLDVAYEQLVASPEEHMRRMLEFLGLDWDPALLRFHESKRAVRTASYAQVRRPLYRSSIGRAASYAAELAPLSAALRAETPIDPSL
jgi:tetratricopeptide (TPR) repeat protein